MLNSATYCSKWKLQRSLACELDVILLLLLSSSSSIPQEKGHPDVKNITADLVSQMT